MAFCGKRQVRDLRPQAPGGTIPRHSHFSWSGRAGQEAPGKSLLFCIFRIFRLTALEIDDSLLQWSCSRHFVVGHRRPAPKPNRSRNGRGATGKQTTRKNGK
jgi:hypothetical protein